MRANRLIMVWCIAVWMIAVSPLFAASLDVLLKTQPLKMDLLKKARGKYVYKDTGEPASGAFEHMTPRNQKEVMTLKDGVQQGPTMTFYKGLDQVEKVRYWDKGKWSEKEEFYRKDGSLWKKRWRGKDGLNHRVEYGKEGQVMAKVQYNHNSLQGDNMAYYPDGRVKVRIHIGKKGETYLTAQFFDETGTAHEIAPDMVTAMIQGESYRIDKTWLRSLTPKQLYDQADGFARTGKNLRAVISLSQLIKIEPDNAEALYDRGINYGLVQRYDEALADYTRVLEIDPEYYRAHWYRGRIYYIFKDWPKALADMEIMAQKAPDDDEPEWVLLAFVNYNLKHYKRAIEVSNGILQKRPRHSRALYVNALAHAKDKNPEMTLKRYQEYMKRNPKDKKLFQKLGRIFISDHAYDSLQRLCETRVQLQPSSAAAHNNLAWFYATAEDKAYRDGAKAVASALKAVTLKENASHLDTLAAAYLENKEYDKAVNTYERVAGMSEKISGRYRKYLEKHGYYPSTSDDKARMRLAIEACLRDGHYISEPINREKDTPEKNAVPLLD